ncbi:MAG TPA: S8 family serine peptidase, partial [Bacillales bacterium]
MKVRKRCVAQWFSAAMAFLLLFSYGWPNLGQAQAKTSSDVSTSLHKSQLQSKDKISNDLTEKFTKQDQVTFLLKFKEQVNTKKIAAKAVNTAQNNNLSAAKTELKKRTAVVSALRAKSLDTQASVKQFLRKQKKAGKVKSFESFYIVNAMAVTGTKEVAEELAQFGEIEKILPNRTRHLIKTNHSKTKGTKKKASNKAQPKATTSDDDEIGPNIEHIGAPQAWGVGIDGSGVVIASLDSGVQWDHPALKRKYRGYDPENPDQPNNEFNWFDAVAGQDAPYDDLGHGTHTVGTMVGSEPDGTNKIGVAPGAQWIAAKAFTSAGTGSDVDILEAGEWILAPKDSEGNPHPEKAPDIVNNSWGGGRGIDEWFRPMVQNWRAAGIFPAFAAGNTTIFEPGGPGSVSAPGNYPESFAVGATNLDDELAGFSLQGPSPYDEIKPELVAPGVSIRSSVP